MKKEVWERLSHIATVFTFIFTLVIAGIGYTIFRKVDVGEETTAKMEGLLTEATKTLQDNQKRLEASRPHYNLAVGFFDPDATTDPQIKKEIVLVKGVTAMLDIRIWNISTQENVPEGIAESANDNVSSRRADDVSCIVEFPEGFAVSVPYTLQKNVFIQRVDQYRGGWIVGIDYGDDYALHPGTNFIFRVNVTPTEKGRFPIKVTADTDNPNSWEPAIQDNLYITVE